MFAYKFVRKTQESFTSKFVKILVVKLAVLRINYLINLENEEKESLKNGRG